jgi:succinate-acetate transporter protein
MKDKFLKDLPIFINGFAVGFLLFGIPNIGLMDISMYVLAMISFFWYGGTQRTIK